MNVVMRRTLVLWAALFAPAALGCGRASDPASGDERAPGPNRDPMELRLDPTMVRSVQVEEVTVASLPVTMKVFGKVSFDEDHLASVLAPLPGHVVRLAARVGDPVRAGEILFQIRSRDVASVVGESLESRKDLELSERTYAMTKELFDSQAASMISLKQAENDLAKARGRLARTQAVLKALGVEAQGEELTSLIPVRAPISGTVTDRKVSEGQYETGDNSVLMTIADLSSVWVIADLFERDLSRAAVGKNAEVTTLAYPDVRFMGTVSRISDVLDPNTRTAKVRIQVPNPDGHLKPEMLASVLLFLKGPEPTVTLPSRAAFTEGGRHFVFLEKEKGVFERRRVDVLPATDGRLRVVEGLRAGDRVVSEDVMLLRAQQAGGESK